MPQIQREINDTTTTIPAPIDYPTSGTVTVDVNNAFNLVYTGTEDLANFGTPPNTGTVEPIVLGGETGVYPANTGKGQLGYTYLLLNTTDGLLVKVLGIQLQSLVSGTYKYLIYTDTDCSGISAISLKIVFAKLVGYSINVTSGTATINGIDWTEGSVFGEPQLAPQENRNGFQEPLLVKTAGTVLVIENS